MGVMPYGAGTVFFMGDTNSIELVPQPLIDNLLAYMLGFQALESQIQHLGLNGGNTNALLAKLRAAQASIAAGNTSAAINQLRALTNQVRALLNAGKLTQAQADALNLAVETIVETLAP